MARIRSFRALRPLPESACGVSAVPYDVVNAEEARALASGNPWSFLHVSRAEIDLPPSTDPYSNLVYSHALENFTKLCADAPLIQEETPSLYFYRLQMGAHRQLGLAACYSLDEYNSGLIKKHERTRKDKEDDRTRHIITLKAQTGPVFLIYRASNAIDEIAGRVTSTPPLFDFEAPDKVRHTIWRIDARNESALIAEFGRLPCLYIADGHHRAASAARTRAYLAEKEPGSSYADADWVYAVAFPHNQTLIMPYHRVVKDLAGQTPQEFLTKIKARGFLCGSANPAPAAKGDISMYLEGSWYGLRLKAGSNSADIGSTLDVSLLQDQILSPMLNILDPRTDKRIDFVGGIRGTGELERLVNENKAAVAFSLCPVSVEDLMRLADAGEIMPPKSTWFEPKLRDGLLNHLI
jgi:uncharacterized protein (DUF1015 family)